MKYGYTIIYVDNVKETVEFYHKAFGFQQKFLTPENDYGELISGETTIAFASIELGNSNFKKAVEKGAIEFEPLTEKPWGQKVGYVRDNNGFLIEICTPIKSSQ